MSSGNMCSWRSPSPGRLPSQHLGYPEIQIHKCTNTNTNTSTNKLNYPTCLAHNYEPPGSSRHHREIQPSTMHCTEYLLSEFPRRNLRIAWIFKRILCRNTARREISFAKTFRIQKIFEKRWSAGLEIPGGKIEEGSDKLRDISAKSASCKSNHPAVTFKRSRIISTIISCL